jgi:hypothetical protein
VSGQQGLHQQCWSWEVHLSLFLRQSSHPSKFALTLQEIWDLPELITTSVILDGRGPHLGLRPSFSGPLASNDQRQKIPFLLAFWVHLDYASVCLLFSFV